MVNCKKCNKVISNTDDLNVVNVIKPESYCNNCYTLLAKKWNMSVMGSVLNTTKTPSFMVGSEVKRIIEEVRNTPEVNTVQERQPETGFNVKCDKCGSSITSPDRAVNLCRLFFYIETLCSKCYSRKVRNRPFITFGRRRNSFQFMPLSSPIFKITTIFLTLGVAMLVGILVFHKEIHGNPLNIFFILFGIISLSATVLRNWILINKVKSKMKGY